MHYDLPFKASSTLMVFRGGRELKESPMRSSSVQRGQIIGAAMCLHTYHRALKMKNVAITNICMTN